MYIYNTVSRNLVIDAKKNEKAQKCKPSVQFV